jgi:hypothetical protein
MWLLRPLPLLAAAVALCLAVAGGVTLLGDTGPVTRPATQPATQPVNQPVTQPATQPASPRAPMDREVLRALDVLASWDRWRAAAYSSGDVAALRRLYVRGSTVGRDDVRMLRAYVDRGLAVRGLELQRSDVDVLSSTHRRLRVELLERLAEGTVVAADRQVALPRDRPERRVVTLVRGEQRWQVASVVRVGAPSAARPGSGR